MKTLVRLLAGLCLAVTPMMAQAQAEPIGIVIMHGKGGSPAGLVAGLARQLEGQGFLVANLEMPWSGKRNYDVPVARAEEEVEAAVAGLRGKGAKKVFVSGHSQGGVFALHLAGKLAVDGCIAIAPGGDVASWYFRQQLGASVTRAQRLVAEGKGNEPAPLEDHEGSKGTYSVVSPPAFYLTWFDTAGAMNMDRAVRAANPRMPILWIAPTRDYPGLLKVNPPIYRPLMRNPLNRLHQPDADHRGAPTASADEIVRWTRELANAPPR